MTFNPPDTASLIRQLPRSVAPFKWMFGLEILLGLKPFNSEIMVVRSRPQARSVISCWGMLFYLINSISFATSFMLWQFTDMYSVTTHPIGFMRSIVSYLHMSVMLAVCLVFNSKYCICFIYFL